MTDVIDQAPPAPAKESASPIPPQPSLAEQVLNLSSRPATYDDLMAKPVRTRTFTVPSANPDGSIVSLEMSFKAISPAEYDDLVASHPPTAKQRNQGMVYNIDTFAPALISRVSAVPKLTAEQAAALWSNPDWSPGESGGLFQHASYVCNAGLDLPFNSTA